MKICSEDQQSWRGNNYESVLLLVSTSDLGAKVFTELTSRKAQPRSPQKVLPQVFTQQPHDQRM